MKRLSPIPVLATSIPGQSANGCFRRTKVVPGREFPHVRIDLQYLNPGEPSRVIGLTSSESGEERPSVR